MRDEKYDRLARINTLVQAVEAERAAARKQRAELDKIIKKPKLRLKRPK